MDQELPISYGSPVSENKQSTWFWPLIITMSAFLLFFAGFFIWILSQKHAVSYPQLPQTVKTETLSSISGIIAFDGYASPEAYLAISERKVGKETGFKDVVSGIIPTSGTIPWIWKDAVAGSNYEIRVSLKSRGNIIEQSASTFVSSPATDVAVRLISDQQPPLVQIASISGTIDLKGYVPPGSSINILAKTLGAATFGTIATALPADNATWSWNGAAEGTTYDMKAQIISLDGTIISNEQPIVVTAPSNSQILKAQSVILPPTPTISGISGSITLNGTVPSGSYITIGTRKTGTQTFDQVASHIVPVNGASWSWSNASTGTSYDIQAYLWVNGKPYAASQISTITAPSTYETLTINAEEPLAAPSITSFNVTCGSKQGGLFQVNFSYNTQNNLPNPQQYNLVVSSGSGGGQAVNTVVAPPSPNQAQTLTTTAVVQPGATYFAQYAYAQCKNCGTFSPLSTAIQFACQ